MLFTHRLLKNEKKNQLEGGNIRDVIAFDQSGVN